MHDQRHQNRQPLRALVVDDALDERKRALDVADDAGIDQLAFEFGAVGKFVHALKPSVDLAWPASSPNSSL